MGCGGSGVSCKAAAASPSHVSGSRLNRFFDGTCGRPPATRVEAWTGPGHLVRTSNPNSRPKCLARDRGFGSDYDSVRAARAVTVNRSRARKVLNGSHKTAEALKATPRASAA